MQLITEAVPALLSAGRLSGWTAHADPASADFFESCSRGLGIGASDSLTSAERGAHCAPCIHEETPPKP